MKDKFPIIFLLLIFHDSSVSDVEEIGLYINSPNTSKIYISFQDT